MPPVPRCPARTRKHHTVHTGRSSTCGIVRLPVAPDVGATVIHDRSIQPQDVDAATLAGLYSV